MKRVFFEEDARRRVLGGAELLYRAVKTTMGKRGRNVVIGKPVGSPSVTHDGVTVARSISVPDVDDETLGYNIGAEIIKEVANKMNDMAGDGTTTVTVLAYHILSEANKLIAAGHNSMLLRSGLDKAAKDVLSRLDGIKIPIDNDSQRIAEVATISAGDAEIGRLIADVIDKVGKDGVITVEASQGIETESEVAEGYTFDRGFISPYMAPSSGKPEVTLNNPAIIVTDKKIADPAEIKPLIEKLIQNKRTDILLIADNVEGEALSVLIMNKLKGALNTIAVHNPGYGDKRVDTLEDIAALTGGKLISSTTGLEFEHATLEHVGTARKVVVNKGDTTIIDGAGDPKDVEQIVDTITAAIGKSKSAYDKNQLEKRRGALKGTVAIIKVGGATETEIEEKKYRVDDAVAAVRAGMADGIVPGGGVTLARIATELKTLEDPTEQAGAQLLAHALIQPFRTIITNAGANPDKWLPLVQEAKFGFGVDVTDPTKLVDLMAIGVVDPVMVTKKAVQYATSVAGTNITMDALIVDVPKEVTT